MKTFNKTSMPQIIIYRNEIYSVNLRISAGMQMSGTNPKNVLEALKSTNSKGVLVNVLSNNLKDKLDLNGKPYEPSRWVYTNTEEKDYS